MSVIANMLSKWFGGTSDILYRLEPVRKPPEKPLIEVIEKWQARPKVEISHSQAIIDKYSSMTTKQLEAALENLEDKEAKLEDQLDEVQQCMDYVQERLGK